VSLASGAKYSYNVANVAQSCSYHTRALRHIKPVLSLDCAKDIATSIVGTRLDYCNSLLLGTSQRNFDRLQRLQNNLARVVLQAPARASATDLRRELHWLPIDERVKFKIATLTFKAKRGVPDCLWGHIPLQKNFWILSEKKCMSCMSVQLNILCLICINRQYSQNCIKFDNDAWVFLNLHSKYCKTRTTSNT